MGLPYNLMYPPSLIGRVGEGRRYFEPSSAAVVGFNETSTVEDLILPTADIIA